MSWRERAECLGRDMFPDPGDGEAVAACMELCARCPVAAECEAWREEEHPEFGVWAGRLMDLYPPPGARICDWCIAAGEDPPTEAMARGLCNRHYQQEYAVRRGRKPAPPWWDEWNKGRKETA